MPSGLDAFQISNIQNVPSSEDLWTGEVRFVADGKAGQYEVAHHVTVKVRVTASARSTVEELREALYQEAVKQLRRALQVAEGRSAQELLAVSRDGSETLETSIAPRVNNG